MAEEYHDYEDDVVEDDILVDSPDRTPFLDEESQEELENIFAVDDGIPNQRDIYFKSAVMVLSALALGTTSGLIAQWVLPLIPQKDPPLDPQLDPQLNPQQPPDLLRIVKFGLAVSVSPLLALLVSPRLVAKFGQGKSLIIGSVLVLISYLIACITNAETPLLIAIGVGTFGDSYLGLSWHIWTARSARPYTLMGLLVGMGAFPLAVAGPLANILSAHNWKSSDYFKVALGVWTLVATAIFFSFRHEISSTADRALKRPRFTFRKSVKTKWVWFFALFASLYTSIFLLLDPSILIGLRNADPTTVAPSSILQWTSYGVGCIIIGFGMDKMKEKQHRILMCLAAAAVGLFFLFTLFAKHSVAKVFYAGAVICSSQVGQAFWIIAMSILPDYAYIQGIVSAVLMSVIVGWIIMVPMGLFLSVGGTWAWFVTLSFAYLGLAACYHYSKDVKQIELGD